MSAYLDARKARRERWEAAKQSAVYSDPPIVDLVAVIPMAKLSDIPGHEMTPIGELPPMSHNWSSRRPGATNQQCTGDPSYRPLTPSLPLQYIQRGPTWYKQRINCGRCEHCRTVRVNQFATAIVMELADVGWSCWLTFTFRNSKERQEDQWHKILKMRPFQLFADLFRVHAKRGKGSFDGLAEQKIRYSMVGEYGSLRGRAHFHVLLWGSGERPRWLKEGMRVDRMNIPEWPHGHVCVVDGGSHHAARYQAKYMFKEMTEEKFKYNFEPDPDFFDPVKQDLWDQVYRLRYRYYRFRRRRPLRHWSDDEKAIWKTVMDDIFPPKAIWSRSNRSGLGSRWALKFAAQLVSMGLPPPIDWRVKVAPTNGYVAKLHDGLLRGAARRDFILEYARLSGRPIMEVAKGRSVRMQAPVRAADVWLRRRLEAKMPLADWLAGFADQIVRKSADYHRALKVKPSEAVVAARAGRGEYVPRAHRPLPDLLPDPLWASFTRIEGPRTSYRF